MSLTYCSDNPTAEINGICQPLFDNTPISMFCYGQFYFDNRAFSFDTYGEWHDFLLQERGGKDIVRLDFFDALDMSKNIFNDRSGCSSLIVGDISPSFRQNLLQEFKIESFLWLIEKHADYFELFGFGSKEGKNISDFYFNHYDVLEKFMLYFNEHSKDMIARAKKNWLVLPDSSNEYRKLYTELLDKACSGYNNINELETLLSLKKYPLVIDNEKIYLTPKELLCLHYLSRSNTCKEIGNILGIGKRTVDTHIDAAKSKLNVYTKKQLLDLFRTSKLFNIYPPH